ncbi:hypothetical protein [Grimontia marina]|uniref:Lipoprotein n=1 Tax=Grimontia marina TaxID=646534 RepID=A0A128FHT0_9GAMM|nr:hypothetical protein [Grimontia marina]CZF85816.1 hypothetical protein GMA8713_03849 [Grimontia marina]
MKRCLHWLLPILLVGCGGDNDGSTGNSPPSDNPNGSSNAILQLEQKGEIPKLERGTDLMGSDQNNNGVRDDIDSFIGRSYPVPNQQAAATQSAKAFQQTLAVDKSDILAVKAANQTLSRALNCLFDQFDGENGTIGPARVSLEIKSATFNTKLRLLEYLTFSEALDGTSWALPVGDTCER